MDPPSTRPQPPRLHSPFVPTTSHASVAMTAPPLYDGEVPVVGASYFAGPPQPSMAMHMQRRMRQPQSTNEALRYRTAPPPSVMTAPPRFDPQWPASTPRRMSLSEDPSLSPMGLRPPETSSGRSSPTADGVTLPTLSTMLHHTWSPQQWPRQDPTPTMPGQLMPPTHRRAPSLSISPTFTPVTGRRPASSSWDGSRDFIAQSPSSHVQGSPMQVTTPKFRAEDDPMEMSPRERNGSSSPSSSSTMSVHDDNQRDEDESKSGSPTKKGDRKTSRYLREMDRRAILERLARGEKQATLAKEYNVSRAAICNLFKHRHEVMARTDEDPFAKHPKKRKNKKTLKSRRSRSLRLASAASSVSGSGNRAVVTPPTAPTSVIQVQSDSVLLLLTIMSDRRSGADEFRRASERVLWLLIEEALSAVPIKLTQVTVAAESKIMGVTTEHPPCAISMEQHSSPMLEVFQLLEPERPYGQIRLLDSTTNACSLVDAHLPQTLKYHNVFLFDIAIVSSDTVRAMIECAKERGALEVMIYVVALFISADVVETLQQTYPHVRVVTTQIEANILETQKNRRSCVDVVLGRFDQVYQTQYTLV